jgi:BASS family bile acid:Na+ symporter
LNTTTFYIDEIRIAFNTDQLWMLNLALAFVMFGVALDIRLADFRRLSQIPKAVLGGIFSQFLLLPSLTFLLVILLKPHPSFALGMFLVAACPGGNVSNFMTHLAKGNSALSVSLTAVATLLAAIMTPVNLGLWGSWYEPTAGLLRSIHIDLYEMAEVVALLLGIPLILGMLIGHFKPKLAHRLVRIFKMGSLLFFMALVIMALWRDREAFKSYVGLVFGIVLLHNALALSSGYIVARILKLPLAETKTLTLETGIQNSGLGLLLIFGFFEGLGGMALIAAFWGIWHLISGLLIAGVWGRINSETTLKIFFYDMLKGLIRLSLLCYYSEVRLEGVENIPQNKPVLLLPNHQNGLLDPLILAAFIPNYRPYFLTRSDVFRKPLLRKLFSFFRMLPIYRMRDGRNTLGKNQAIFDTCVRLLENGETVLLFPEANHHIGRSVRPLSKGFTRIVFQALDEHDAMNLELVPVGINYQRAQGFPDKVLFTFGKPISAQPFAVESDRISATRNLIFKVSESLRNLTTHLPEGVEAEQRMKELNALRPNFLKPSEINQYLKGSVDSIPELLDQNALIWKGWDWFMKSVNFPVIQIWKRWVAPKIGEVEFLSTFRFAFAIVVFPVYFAILGTILGLLSNNPIAILVTTLLFLNNLLYVKFRRIT